MPIFSFFSFCKTRTPALSSSASRREGRRAAVGVLGLGWNVFRTVQWAGSRLSEKKTVLSVMQSRC